MPFYRGDGMRFAKDIQISVAEQRYHNLAKAEILPFLNIVKEAAAQSVSLKDMLYAAVAVCNDENSHCS